VATKDNLYEIRATLENYLCVMCGLKEESCIFYLKLQVVFGTCALTSQVHHITLLSKITLLIISCG